MEASFANLTSHQSHGPTRAIHFSICERRLFASEAKIRRGMDSSRFSNPRRAVSPDAEHPSPTRPRLSIPRRHASPLAAAPALCSPPTPTPRCRTSPVTRRRALSARCRVLHSHSPPRLHSHSRRLHLSRLLAAHASLQPTPLSQSLTHALCTCSRATPAPRRRACTHRRFSVQAA